MLSLIIVLMSGMFIGMVLALQGYETLVRFGATESMGVLVALSLVRELGPVVVALLFASRAGSAMTAEIGLMKTTEQLSAMEVMAAVDPSPAWWHRGSGRRDFAAVAGGAVLRARHLWRLSGRRAPDWHRRRRLLGQMAAVDWRYDVLNGVIKSRVRRGGQP